MPISPPLPETDQAVHERTVPLEVIPEPPARFNLKAQPEVGAAVYSPERQRDWVRLIVTCGLLLLLAYIIIFASIQSASSSERWQQAKELLQILLPAVTGIIGTVIGFYFGSTAAGNKSASGEDES